MAEDLVVKCPLAQLKTKDGTYVHLYEGAPVPDLYKDDETGEDVKKTLLDEGLIGPEDKDFVPGKWTGPDNDRKWNESKWVAKKDDTKSVPKAPLAPTK
jgi:hypothetical protein